MSQDLGFPFQHLVSCFFQEFLFSDEEYRKVQKIYLFFKTGIWLNQALSSFPCQHTGWKLLSTHHKHKYIPTNTNATASPLLLIVFKFWLQFIMGWGRWNSQTLSEIGPGAISNGSSLHFAFEEVSAVSAMLTSKMMMEGTQVGWYRTFEFCQRKKFVWFWICCWGRN